MSKSLLEEKIGYKFKNASLLEEALTHPSLSHDQKNKSIINYERLEFLGDSVLGMLVAELLINIFPDEQEGALAKRHSWLVKGETLTKIGEAVDIGSALLMTSGEEQTGGRQTASNLENAVEALIGALYLDGGLEVAKGFVQKYWFSLAKQVQEPPKDPKTALQEWVQAKGLPLPSYKVLSAEGPDHAPIFTVELKVKGYPVLTGEGTTRKRAEKKIASLFLEQHDL